MYDLAQYNGNISGQSWRMAGYIGARQYDYSYDAANRLMKAEFEQDKGGWGKSLDFNSYMGSGNSNDPNSAYDLNGNIKRMQQWGWTPQNVVARIDSLTYTYSNGSTANQTFSNKLLAVYDQSTVTGLGDFENRNASATDYVYDGNGNMTKDYNKRIGKAGTTAAVRGITYNHLNLPDTLFIFTASGTAKGRIYYLYDANGQKLRKTVVENSIPVVVNGVTYTKHDTTFTHYLGGIVYQSKNYSNSTVRNNLRYSYQLQFFGHEEGRVRAIRATPKSNLDNLVYDYMLKDHLGNVRMVLTEEQQINRYPSATLEGIYGGTTNSLVNHEAKFFNIDASKITDESSIPSWGNETGTTKDYFNHNGNPPANDQYPAGVSPASTARSSKLYRLNATENKTGLEFMLKVMAGDKVDIFGNSYYQNTGEITNNNSTPLDLLTILSAWLTVPGSGLAGKGLTAGQLNSLNTGLIPSSFIRGYNNEAGQTIPKAYINYLFFDEQFQYVNGGFSRVGASDTVKRHWYEDAALQNITVPKNGYIFVYVSNESNLNVFFDNVQVIHKPGALLEETHYYPFGLTMAGICSKAAGKLENKFKYQEYELNNDFDLDLYQSFYRTHDPQLGRFWQIDPKIEMGYEDISPYSSMHNNPILISDPLGDFDDYMLKQDGHIELVKKTADKTDQLYATDKSGNIIKDKSITVQKGIISNVMNNSPTGENPNGTSYLGTINNKYFARNLFEFLANNSEVEWGMITFGLTTSKFQDTRISTSHNESSNKSLSGLADKYLSEAATWPERLIFEVTHSHPAAPGYVVDFPSGFHRVDGSKGPLMGDRQRAAQIEASYRKNPVIMGVYDVSSKRYIYYNSQKFIRK